MFAYLKQKSVPLTFNIWRHVRSASRNSWSLEENPAWHFSCILFTLSLDFFSARVCTVWKWVKNETKKWGENRAGAYWSLNIPALNMKIYYGIMCSFSMQA